jgi:iron complex transport system substrate-binding protein
VEVSVVKAVADALAAQQVMAEESGSIVLTDIAGRTVTIEKPVERVILGEGRQIYIVAALQPGNPFNRLVGWRNDLRLFDADTFNKYKELFPEVADIEEFGSPYSGEFSVERAIALDADVVTLNLGGLERAKEAGMIDQLAAVGIPWWS